MGKKILLIFMIVVSIGCIILGVIFMKNSDVFEPYPEKIFLNISDSTARPVYELLTKKEQAVYSALYNGISEKNASIPLPYDITGETYSKIYCILEKQEGKFFYIDSTYYTARKIRNAKIVFREDVSEIDTKINQLESAVENIISGAPDGDYGKALYIHDKIAEICTYNIGDDYQYSATAYGCLVGGQANCEGYAKAFNYLAGRLGMKCVLVTGKTDKGENHAWNQIMIDGDWYNIDVTWDDMDDVNGVRRVYFLCSDETFSRTHIADNTYFTSFLCISESNNYYVRNGFFARNNSEAYEIIRRELDSGNHVIELKFPDNQAYNEFKSEYIDGQKMFDIILDSGYIGDGQIALTLRETEEEYCITMDFS
ncbi:MAG: hypothetical protein K2K89_05380 [Ruminococcus sp.]|nr:hypothetical protein [Ruminococcus sp.]